SMYAADYSSSLFDVKNPSHPGSYTLSLHDALPISLRDGPRAQLADRAPRRAVVDVHVHGLALAQALDEAEVLDEVHAAVPRAARALLERLPDRMLELGAVRLQLFPPVLGAAALDVDLLLRVLAHDALRPLEQDPAAVGPRRVRVVRYQDGLPAARPDQGVDDVAQRVALLGLRALRPDVLRGPEVEPAGRAGHRDQV